MTIMLRQMSRRGFLIFVLIKVLILNLFDKQRVPKVNFCQKITLLVLYLNTEFLQFYPKKKMVIFSKIRYKKGHTVQLKFKNTAFPIF